MRKRDIRVFLGVILFCIILTIALYNLHKLNNRQEDKMALSVTKELMDAQTLKVKFFTAGYSHEVDRYLNEEMEKFLHEDLTKYRTLNGAPSIFISSGKDVLIAVPYRELALNDDEVLKFIMGMEEKEPQSFINWKQVVKNLTDKGHRIGTE